MRSPAGNILHCRTEQSGVNVPTDAGPGIVSGVAHRDGDAEIRVPGV